MCFYQYLLAFVLLCIPAMPIVWVKIAFAKKQASLLRQYQTSRVANRPFKPRSRLLFAATLFVSLAGCGQSQPADMDADEHGFTAPTSHTLAANKRVTEILPFDDKQDYEDATRGLIAAPESLAIKSPASSEYIWNRDAFDFVDQSAAPGSVNPSLWRQAQLNNKTGLFKVTDGIYQLRGFDLANLTIIEGERGWILLDPLTNAETAKVALEFARSHLGEKPVTAIMFSHSHVDHFGGVAGALEYADENLRIIAPQGFIEEATSENVMAGVPMQRRASYMYGKYLPKSVRGHVDTGLGKEPAFIGHIGIAEPTDIVTTTGQTLVVDGVEFVFQNAAGSEAPAELTFYLPQFKAYCGGEVLSRTMHNLYTLRGAKVRDALKWAHYIDEAKDLFAEAEVYFGTHHWPLWGSDRIQEFLTSQRDIYKYLHDQTMRMASWGATPTEIANQISMPESLATKFYNRGYYGTPMHNSRAVYQAYFGWYDGNPANLHPLPEAEAGKKFVDYMGGADQILSKAQGDFDNGEYRWVAQVLNKLVFAEPSNDAAKQLLAKAYDQLGYQAESGPWRDVYLSAAYELRHGKTEQGAELSNALELMREIPMDKFFESMAARLDAEKVDGENTTVVFEFPEKDEVYTLWLSNSVLHHKQGAIDTADATLRISHELFLKVIIGTASLKEVLFGDEISVTGSRLKLLGLLSAIEQPDGTFALVTAD